jgi:hypothetical protein
MPAPGVKVNVTTEVAYCPFCQRTRNLRREERHLGGLVRTIVTCESCNRTLSSTMGVPAAEPAEAPAAPAVPEPEPVAPPAPKRAPVATRSRKATAKSASKPSATAAKAPARKAPEKKPTTTRKATSKKK